MVGRRPEAAVHLLPLALRAWLVLDRQPATGNRQLVTNTRVGAPQFRGRVPFDTSPGQRGRAHQPVVYTSSPALRHGPSGAGSG